MTRRPWYPEGQGEVYIYKKSNDLELIKQFKECNYEIYKQNLMKNLVPNSPTDLIENKSLLLENNFQPVAGNII